MAPACLIDSSLRLLQSVATSQQHQLLLFSSACFGRFCLAHSSRSQSAVLPVEQNRWRCMCATTDTHRLISVRFAEETKIKIKNKRNKSQRRPKLELASSNHLPRGWRNESAPCHEVRPMRHITPLHYSWRRRTRGIVDWGAPAPRGHPSASVRAQQQQGGASRRTRLARRIQEERALFFQSKSCGELAGVTSAIRFMRRNGTFQKKRTRYKEKYIM